MGGWRVIVCRVGGFILGGLVVVFIFLGDGRVWFLVD